MVVVDILDVRMVSIVCFGWGIKDIVIVLGGIEFGLLIGRGNKVLCIFGFCGFLRILVMGRVCGGRLEIMFLEVDVCVVGVITDGRINGSLLIVLEVGREDLEVILFFEIFIVVFLFLDEEYKLFLLIDVFDDFDVVLDLLLFFFILVNFVVVILISFVRETVVCEGVRLCLILFYVYFNFNFGGFLSL